VAPDDIEGKASTMELGSKTVYEIYLKSFKDSDGDGIGDLAGITDKLDYLSWLGVDYLWITPFFVSPQNDNGYDVADYRAIDPRFGTMDDFDDLVRAARSHGIGLMLDMVLNHTSTDHEWFQRALAGDEECQARYYFVDGDPDRAPTNWESKFGGSAWEYVPSLGKWYLHLFDVSQADLNWSNPTVRHDMADVVRFWKDKGVAGFRFDVINLVSKPESFVDDDEGDGRRFYTDGPRMHEYLRQLVREAGIEDCPTVGEMSSTSLVQCVGYSRPADRELSQTFSFHHLKVDYPNGEKWQLMGADIAQLRELLRSWQEGMQAGGGWNALFWCNHDQPRCVSRFGDDGRLWQESAKMLAIALDLLRGTPYIYQGEEIGMTNAHFDSIGQYRDVESLNHYKLLVDAGSTSAEALHVLAERSRDNARTPVQWDGDAHAGFSSGEPWIGLAHSTRGCDQGRISVEAERNDASSVLSTYRSLVALRKQLPSIAEGEVRFLDEAAVPVIEYVRYGYLRRGAAPLDADMPLGSSVDEGSVLVLANFSDTTRPIGAGALSLLARGDWELLVGSYPTSEGLVFPRALRPYEGVALIRR
jgi:trehalose-6-phosphate hydrolase